MKITIIYDNEVYEGDLENKHGFSCLIETDHKQRILFDTGGDESILMDNMKKLNIKPETIDDIFISHGHWDHIRGLSGVLSKNDCANIYITSSCLKRNVQIPPSYDSLTDIENTSLVTGEREIGNNTYTTGELNHEEQSLIIDTEHGQVIIVGCSHPGVGNILNVARKHGEVYALIGGFHGFKDFEILKNLELICPTHCTEYKDKIISLYPDKCISGGVGRVIKI